MNTSRLEFDARVKNVACGAGYGMHWEELDEDVSAEVLLRQQAEAEKYLAHVARS